MRFQKLLFRLCGANHVIDRLVKNLAEKESRISALENSIDRVYRSIGITYRVPTPVNMFEALEVLRSVRARPATIVVDTVTARSGEMLNPQISLRDAVETFLHAVDSSPVMCSACGHFEDADEIEGIDDLREAFERT